MGSGGSKADDGGPGGSEGERTRRWLQASAACFRPPSSTARDHGQARERLDDHACAEKIVTKSQLGRGGGCWKFEVPQLGQATCSSSSCSRLNGCCQALESTSHSDPGDSSSSSTHAAAITWTSNAVNRSCSHPSFIPDGIASQLERAASLGSSDAHPIFPASYSVQNPEGDGTRHKDSIGSSDTCNGTQEGTVPADNVSSQDTTRSNMDAGARVSGYSRRNLARTGNLERDPSTRCRSHELLEGSIRFSRTLSVGRLRDRVLLRPSFSDRFSGHLSLEDRLVEYHDNGGGGRALHQAVRGVVSSDSNTDMFSTSSPNNPRSLSSPMGNRNAHESEAPQLRETSDRDILEHRSAFIERRRRIRSQVQALQQLGNQVENFPGHHRSCILSGQHRAGHCSCRTSSRPASRDDGRSARSSISRIVMLAEALFEVLDEIHQQAVVLASRPSVSSVGSLPAPKEVVERMPLRIHEKPRKHRNEDTAQCYICLVEYEEGDCVRILPCCHDFHKTCVDKWLKEVHRVCPLCRGDVCISDLSPTEKFS